MKRIVIECSSFAKFSNRAAARVSPLSPHRLVRNQLLYHEINERIREIAERFDSKSRATFICECSREDCVESMELELDEYRAIRSSPTLFVVDPGHETLEVENVVETNDRYALVETIRKLERVTESRQPITQRPA